MATGWDLPRCNIIRNVPLGLRDPSYTLLSSPLSALSSSLAPAAAFFLLACSLWQQTFPRGGFSRVWGSGGGFLGSLPSSGLSSAQLQPSTQIRRVKECVRTMAICIKNTQAASPTASLCIAIAWECCISSRGTHYRRIDTTQRRFDGMALGGTFGAGD